VYASYWLGQTLAWTGKPEQAIERFEAAMRLSPKDPWFHTFLFGVSLAHAAAGRAEESVHCAQKSLQLNSGYPLSYLILAGSYVALGRLDEARETVRELLRLHPGVSLTGVKATMTGWDPAFAERSIDALRKAGLPE
jgi:adenylate cyclase